MPDSSGSSCQGRAWPGLGNRRWMEHSNPTVRMQTYQRHHQARIFMSATGSPSTPTYYHQVVQRRLILMWQGAPVKLCRSLLHAVAVLLQKFPPAVISQYSHRRVICSWDPGAGEKWSWADMLFLKGKLDFGQAGGKLASKALLRKQVELMWINDFYFYF